MSARLTIDRGAIERLKVGLRVAATPSYLGEGIGVRDIQRAALAKLKNEFFPRSNKQERDKGYSGHLADGWRAFPVNTGNEVGFELKNIKGSSNERVQTILTSLDKGSRGYIRDLGDKKAISFKGIPGRATRSSEAYAPFIFTSKHVFIPSRRPVNYIEKTYRFVDDELAKRFPDYVRGLRRDMRRWANRD